MTKRPDYTSQDAMSIYTPDPKRLVRIRGPDPIVCQCCEQTFDPIAQSTPMYRWMSYSDVSDSPSVVSIYCKACLPHFGVTDCPFTRDQIPRGK